MVKSFFSLHEACHHCFQALDREMIETIDEDMVLQCVVGYNVSPLMAYPEILRTPPQNMTVFGEKGFKGMIKLNKIIRAALIPSDWSVSY